MKLFLREKFGTIKRYQEVLMNNFDFYCPTRIVFGKGSISRLSDLISNDKKILLIYGGGSIKSNGVYDQVISALAGKQFVEFSGIEPNPRYETCMRAVELIKQENIDFLLAVGGGSVLDATKFIAAAAKFDGQEPWDILSKSALVKDALPLASVITLPATGSEMNGNSVISRESTNEKLAFASEKVYPVFSIIDPETTYSLPLRQTINGIVDTYVHVMEQYSTFDVNTPLQDQWALGLVKTLIPEALKVIESPNDYEARANIFWCATCGLNYWIALGCVQDWSTHMIGHELTALYGLDHGQTLAIVLPRLWESQKASKVKKLAKLGREVFGYKGEDELAAAEFTIYATEEFFKSIGQKTRLADYGIDSEEAAEKIAQRFKEKGIILGETGTIDYNVVYEIVKAC